MVLKVAPRAWEMVLNAETAMKYLVSRSAVGHKLDFGVGLLSGTFSSYIIYIRLIYTTLRFMHKLAWRTLIAASLKK